MKYKAGSWLLLALLAPLVSGQAGAQTTGYLYCGLIEPGKATFYSDVFPGRHDEIPTYTDHFRRFVARRTQVSNAAVVGCDFSDDAELVERKRQNNIHKEKSYGHRVVLTRWTY